jgi:hypothetical protein
VVGAELFELLTRQAFDVVELLPSTLNVLVRESREMGQSLLTQQLNPTFLAKRLEDHAFDQINEEGSFDLDLWSWRHDYAVRCSNARNYERFARSNKALAAKIDHMIK